jgi:hypothetical protein
MASMVDLLICAATELESALLQKRFDGERSSVALVRTGVGAVNAAHAVTLFLLEDRALAKSWCAASEAPIHHPGLRWAMSSAPKRNATAISGPHRQRDSSI